MICWAGLREAKNHTKNSNKVADPALERAEGRLFRAFVTKRLPVALLPLPRIAEITRRVTERIDARSPSPWGPRLRDRQRKQEESREVDRIDYWLDTEVLSSGFAFLGSLAEASEGADRQRLLDYHSAVLALFLSTMPKIERPEQEVEGTPYEFDRWVLGITAALVAQLSLEEARPFWQPIMDLGPGAHYWVEDFCHSWLLTGRQFAATLEAFGIHWRELILYSLHSAQWTGEMSRSYRLEDCSIQVIGLGLMLDIIAAEEFTPVIRTLAPEFEQWAKQWLSHSRPASRFAYFLSCPAGHALLPSGIVWLNRGVQNFSKHGWKERDLPDALVGALRACWRNNCNSVISNADIQDHFLQLLNTLCTRLNSEALALRTEISQFIHGGTA